MTPSWDKAALTSCLDVETCLFETVNGISSMAANTENTKHVTLHSTQNLCRTLWKRIWLNGPKWQNAQSSDSLGNSLRQSEMKAFFIRRCVWLSPPRRTPPAPHPLSLLITLDYSWSCLVKETFDSKNKSPTRTRRKKKGERERQNSRRISICMKMSPSARLSERKRERERKREVDSKEDLPRVRWYN